MMQSSPDWSPSTSGEVYLFAAFELIPSRGVLMKNGVELPLRRQCFQVLHYLVRHPGVLVSRRELMDAVWGSVAVTDSSLTQCILTIRHTLEDESKSLLRSMHRSGYLFDAPVTVRNTSPPEAHLVPAPPVAKRSPVFWSAAAILLLALLGFIYAWISDPNGSTGAGQPATAAPLPASIAVLPFKDLSSSRDQEQLADVMSEEVQNTLARNPNLVVIAGTSANVFKGTNKDTKSIAARLNVANLLEGSVRRDGNRLHVIARLVNASADRSLWSQTYDVEANDTHLLRKSIASAVVSTLGVEQSENISVAPTDPEARRHYLMGKHFHSREAPGDFDRAIREFRSAVEIDPGMADAWVGLAGSMWLRAYEQPYGFAAIREEYKSALDRALELEPNHPDANARIAAYYSDVGQDNLADQYYERSVEFGQNSPLVLGAAAGFAYDRFEYQEAVEIEQRAALLDPLGFVTQVNLALFLRSAGRLDESIAVYKLAFDLNPDAAPEYRQDYLVSYFLKGQYDHAEAIALQLPDGAARDQSLAMIYMALDRPDRGGELITRLSALSSVDAALRVAEYYAFSGDTDLSFAWLEQAKNRQSSVGQSQKTNTDFQVFLHSPFLQKLTGDGRWKSWQAYLDSQIPGLDFSSSTQELVITPQ